MIQFGLLDVAMPSPAEMIFEMGLWIPLLIMLLIVGGLIFVFIRNNRDKKEIEKWEQKLQDDQKK